ncbi:hypothetical protein LCGC14_0625910 [marine sediment metagenome]|uniref:Uncharacterized protein n=1 Tax=marine sediment metagenome TaxID=412755 RepID=A0A0F9RMU5_9ZZZZ
MTREKSKLGWKDYSNKYKETTKFLKELPVDDLLELMGYPTTTRNTLGEAQETRLNKMITENHIRGGTV